MTDEKLLAASSLGSDDDCERRRKALLSSPPPPPALHDLREGAKSFQADEKLQAAMHAAFTLEMPLLLTGEPGTGKTQVAWFIAAAYKLGDPLALHVRSNTTAEDLLYRFDSVAYFRDASDAERRALARDRSHYVAPQALWKAMTSSPDPRVLLVDEIDKAPRDFPNDLLHVLDQYWFDVPELDGCPSPDTARLPGLVEEDGRWRVRGTKNRRRPIIVITSNSERRLPEPFLRRCVFHHIELEDPLVEKVVRAHRESFRDIDERQLVGALTAFRELRKKPLRKKPSTAELLAWLALLNRAPKSEREKLTGLTRDLPFLAALLKDHEDLATVAP